jgi:hypothetical protein
MVRMSIQDWLYLAFVFFVSITITYRMYKRLGTYAGWQSPWKRLLIVSPAVIALVFLAWTTWYTTTHF